MKTTFAFVVLACVALSVSGCGSSPQNLIVGKWEAGQTGVKLSAEFSKDGKAKLTIFGKTLQGTYKVNSGDELEWTVNGKTTKCKVKVTATELELTSEGNTVTYKKV
jgi:uncharacterized protein (TIGR03066 family)